MAASAQSLTCRTEPHHGSPMLSIPSLSIAGLGSLMLSLPSLSTPATPCHAPPFQGFRVVTQPITTTAASPRHTSRLRATPRLVATRLCCRTRRRRVMPLPVTPRRSCRATPRAAGPVPSMTVPAFPLQCCQCAPCLSCRGPYGPSPALSAFRLHAPRLLTIDSRAMSSLASPDLSNRVQTKPLLPCRTERHRACAIRAKAAAPQHARPRPITPGGSKSHLTGLCTRNPSETLQDN